MTMEHPTATSSATIWEAIVETLVEAEVERIFGLPDDDMRAVEALEKTSIDIDWCISQRTAIHKAAGAALATGKPGICVIGRGPAVAAAVPGLLEAYEAHVPIVVLASGTGQDRFTDRPFQDAPTQKMVHSITKWSASIPDVRLTSDLVRSALQRAVMAPSGPVYLEIPDDFREHAPTHGASEALGALQVRNLLDMSLRPVVLLGSGAAQVPTDELVALVDALQAAVLVTASGRGSFPEDHPQFLGLAGLYMQERVTRLISSADTIVALGSKLEETAMEQMPSHASWLQVNLNPQDINLGVRGFYHIGQAQSLVEVLSHQDTVRGRDHWKQLVTATHSQLHAKEHPPSRCADALSHLSQLLPVGSTVVHENGLHDIWSYMYPVLALPKDAKSIVPSEQSTLGFGAAAAIGAATADSPLTVCVAGDTAFASVMPDLQAAMMKPARLLYVIFDDGGLGWLDRQSTLTGTGTRFLTDISPLDCLSGAPWLIDCTSEDNLEASLSEATSRAMEGRPTAIRIRCERDDIAPIFVPSSGDAT